MKRVHERLAKGRQLLLLGQVPAVDLLLAELRHDVCAALAAVPNDFGLMAIHLNASPIITNAKLIEALAGERARYKPCVHCQGRPARQGERSACCQEGWVRG